MMKRILFHTYLILLTVTAAAQTSQLDSAKNEIYRINKVFDSTAYLGFDMDIYYKSDSAGTVMQTDRLSGNYLLNRNNIFYQMGDQTYVQTDSFSYTLYASERMMIMTKNMVQANSGSFPLKSFIDSVVSAYASYYTVAIDTAITDTAGYIKRITFTAVDTGATANDLMPYTSFVIEYNDENYFPSRLGFSFKEPAMSGDSIPVMYISLKTISMNFSSYRLINSQSVFDDATYVLFNRQRKVYEPANKYQAYQLMTSGFENEDPDAGNYREVPYTGGH